MTSLIPFTPSSLSFLLRPFIFLPFFYFFFIQKKINKKEKKKKEEK